MEQTLMILILGVLLYVSDGKAAAIIGGVLGVFYLATFIF